MLQLISCSELIKDNWVRLDDDQVINDHRKVIVSLDRLQQQWDALSSLPLKLGVVLEPTNAVGDVLPFLNHLQIIVLIFEVFADGRAFSQARLLRDRHAYGGDIRAVGDVLCDQLGFMKRNGFNQFQLAEGEDTELAFGLFGDISLTYQAELKQSIAR